jgi:hypothetical protein
LPAHPSLGRAAAPRTPLRANALRSASAAHRPLTCRPCGHGCLICHPLCIVVDLLVAADIRRVARRRESLMRHFLTVALAPAGLPPGMMQAAPQRLLVAVSCGVHAGAARLAGARIGTIPLPVIAAPAHPQLLLAARTVQQAVAGNDHQPTSSPHQAWAFPHGSPRMIRTRYWCSSLPCVTLL